MINVVKSVLFKCFYLFINQIRHNGTGTLANYKKVCSQMTGEITATNNKEQHHGKPVNSKQKKPVVVDGVNFKKELDELYIDLGLPEKEWKKIIDVNLCHLKHML